MTDSPRVPPSSIEAEQAVLGGLLLSPEAFDVVAEKLTAEDFYRHDHQLIFRAITELAERKLPHDAVVLGDWFEAKGLSEYVAGGSYLIELASTTASAANIGAYADIVLDKSRLRRLIEVGTGIVNAAFHPDGRDSAEVLAEAEQSVFALGRNSVLAQVQTGTEVLRRTAMEIARRRSAGPNALLGISTGINALDEMTLGLQGSDLIILAARPSMGKTAMMLHLRRIAATLGRRPYVIEMEMSGEQVMLRDIAAVGRVNFNRVKRPALASEDELARMREAIQKMRQWKWWMDDTSSMSVQQIAARARRMKRQHDIGILFIDYLQFIDINPYLQRGLKVHQALQEVTRTLKSLAKELRIPVVLLSQLNRQLETRGDKRPVMADLRESGAIEQDADLILFLHREGYYHRDTWAKDDPRHRQVEIIIGKARQGEVGKVDAEWDGAFQLFGDARFDSHTTYQERRRGFEPPVRRTGLVTAPEQRNPLDDDE